MSGKNHVKKLVDSNLILSNRIMRIHPNGFMGAVIEGERGYGKSMYALKVMAQIFLEMDNLTETQAFKMEMERLYEYKKSLVKNKGWVELPNGRIVHPDDAKGLR